MRTFDINEFSANATQDGFLRSNLFLCMIGRPKFSPDDTRFLLYLTSGGTLPGSQIITADERVTGYGKPQKIPYDTVHTDLTLNFMSDGAGKSVTFFEEWLRNTVVYGAPGVNVRGGIRGDVHYQDRYQTTIEVFQYNEQHAAGPAILNYKFYEAYPLNISEQALHWNHESEILERQVTFAFRDYSVSRNSVQPGGAAQDDSYLASSYVSGFMSEWAARQGVADGAESVLSGIISSIGLTSALGAISGLASTVNGLVSSVQSLSSMVPSIGSFVPSIPSFPSISFP